LNPAPPRDAETGINMSNTWKGKSGNKKHGKKSVGKKHC